MMTTPCQCLSTWWLRTIFQVASAGVMWQGSSSHFIMRECNKVATQHMQCDFGKGCHIQYHSISCPVSDEVKTLTRSHDTAQIPEHKLGSSPQNNLEKMGGTKIRAIIKDCKIAVWNCWQTLRTSWYKTCLSVQETPQQISKIPHSCHYGHGRVCRMLLLASARTAKSHWQMHAC